MKSEKRSLSFFNRWLESYPGQTAIVASLAVIFTIPLRFSTDTASIFVWCYGVGCGIAVAARMLLAMIAGRSGSRKSWMPAIILWMAFLALVSGVSSCPQATYFWIGPIQIPIWGTPCNNQQPAATFADPVFDLIRKR